MSERKQEDKSSPNYEKVVPDAINKRMMLQTTAFCHHCNIKIPANPKDIESHFNRDHPSTTDCVLCHGKVFYYTYTAGSNKPEETKYHRCIYENEKE